MLYKQKQIQSPYIFFHEQQEGLLLVILSSVVNSIWQLPLPQDFPEVTSAMVNATLSLKQLEWKANLYAINLSVPFNAFLLPCLELR